MRTIAATRRRLPRGRRFVAAKLGRNVFALIGGFATLAAVVQMFVPSILDGASLRHGVVLVVAACALAAPSAFTATSVSATFASGPWSVVVWEGDLLDRDAAVITVDRSLSLDRQDVGSTSLVWQLIAREHGGSPESLRSALRRDPPDAELKPGSLLPVEAPGQPKRFLLACSRRGTAGSEITFGELWSVYERLWAEARVHNLAQVSVPLIGSGFSRSQLSDAALLSGLLLSFHGSSMERPVCNLLNVVLAPGRLDANGLELARSLLSGLGYRCD